MPTSSNRCQSPERFPDSFLALPAKILEMMRLGIVHSAISLYGIYDSHNAKPSTSFPDPSSRPTTATVGFVPRLDALDSLRLVTWWRRVPNLQAVTDVFGNESKSEKSFLISKGCTAVAKSMLAFYLSVS